MNTQSAGFSLLSKSMQARILAEQGEQVPAEPEVKLRAEQPQTEADRSGVIHAENVRKYGAIDAERMRKYGLSERDL